MTGGGVMIPALAALDLTDPHATVKKMGKSEDGKQTLYLNDASEVNR